MTQTRLDERRTHAPSSRRSAPHDRLVASLVDDVAAGLSPEPALIELLLARPDHLSVELASLHAELPHLADLVAGYLGLGRAPVGRPGPARAPWSDDFSPASPSLDDRLDALFDGPAETTAGGHGWHLDDTDADAPDRLARTTALYEELRAEIGLVARPRLELAPLPDDRLGESHPGRILLGERFDPATREGRALLAHELVHEAQRSLTGTPDLLSAESEASSVMGAVLAGGRATAPVVPLPSFAMAACGPRAMRDRVEDLVEPEPDPDPDPVDDVDIERPDPTPIPTPTPTRTQPPIVHVPRPVEIPVPYPVADTPVPTVEIPPNAVIVPVPFPVRVYAPTPTEPGPTEVPTPDEPERAVCEEKCPEPLPEHLSDAPVKKPAEAPAGEGDVRTLKLAGHLVQFRLPKDQKPGQVRVRFRNADSPFGAMTLKTAVLTLDQSLRITGGHLSADIRLGRFVHAPDVKLAVSAAGNVALTIKGARLQVASVARGRLDLTIGKDGIWGEGVLTAKDVVIGPSLTLTDGRLAVRVSKGGAVTAHGKLGVAFKGLGKVEVEVCFADGKLSGKVTATLTRKIDLGLVQITRTKLTGCLREGHWSLTGEVDFTLRSWARGKVKASVSGGPGLDPRWTFEGELTQTKVLRLGPLDVHDAHLKVKYADGRWAPARCDLYYQLPKVRGHLDGTLDLDTMEVSGTGEAEIWDPIRVGPISLDEGKVVATLEKNTLTSLMGSARLRLAYKGQPTFEVHCDQALYEPATGDLHAHGDMTMLRDVALGNPAGLHAKVLRGPAGRFAFEYGRVVDARVNLNVSVAHGDNALGLGSIAAGFSEAAGFSGHIDFSIVERFGIPNLSRGPLFALPPGRFRVDVADDALGVARAEGIQWEVLQPEGPGHLCGTLDGRYDFATGAGELHGEAWIAAGWSLEIAGLTRVTLERGGELVVAVSERGLQSLSGSLDLSLTSAGDSEEDRLAGLSLRGTLAGSFDAETGKVSGTATMKPTAPLELGAAAGRSLWLGPASSFVVGLAEGRLVSLGGFMVTTVHDAEGPVVEISGQGHFDADGGELEHLEGAGRLLRPIAIGGDADDAYLRIDALAGTARIERGELARIAGRLSIALPRLGGGFIGHLEGGWARAMNDGEDDRYWGRGDLEMPIFNDEARGRKLDGKVGVQVEEEGSWVVDGKLDYQLMPRVDGKVSVAMTDTLDPVIGVDLNAKDITLVDARPLFGAHMDLLPELQIGTPMVQLGFGVTAGLDLSMQKLLMNTHIEAEGWRPLSDASTVPDFAAALQLRWGLDAKAELAAHLKVSLGLGPIASLYAGLMTGLVLEVPVRVSPSGSLQGGKDGLSGQLDLDLAISPRLSLTLTPFIGGELLTFDIARHEFSPFVFDLGQPFELEWATSYGFGDETRAPTRRRAQAAPITEGATTQRRESRETPKTFPNKPASPASTEPGLPKIGDEASLGGLGDPKDSAGERKLASMMKVLESLQALATSAATYMRLAQNPLALYTRPQNLSKIQQTWEDLAAKGRTLFAACEDAFGPLKYAIPLWVRLIIEAPPGQTPGFLQAWNEEDDYARRLIEAGVHGALPFDGQVQLVEAMLRGSCGDEDERSILKLLEHAHKHGHGRALIERVGLARLRKNIDGDEREQLELFLAKTGIWL